MRALYKIERTFRQIAAVFLAVTALIIFDFLSRVPTEYFLWSGCVVLVSLFFLIIIKIARRSKKYLNKDGYFVLKKENEMEHRYIAKNTLGRKLKPNEVVHHINGNKTDNGLRNLCVMDAEKHELFHSWLDWKKKKTRRYPKIGDQKQMLVQEYGGILLENVQIVSFTNQSESIKLWTKSFESNDKELFIDRNQDIYKLLFEELRKQRKMLADEKQLPAYMIFDDKTLQEIVETLPDTDELFLQVRGVGPIKLKMYGPYFISLIKKFKSDHQIEAKRNKNFI